MISPFLHCEKVHLLPLELETCASKLSRTILGECFLRISYAYCACSVRCKAYWHIVVEEQVRHGYWYLTFVEMYSDTVGCLFYYISPNGTWGVLNIVYVSIDSISRLTTMEIPYVLSYYPYWSIIVFVYLCKFVYQLYCTQLHEWIVKCMLLGSSR